MERDYKRKHPHEKVENCIALNWIGELLVTTEINRPYIKYNAITTQLKDYYNQHFKFKKAIGIQLCCSVGEALPIRALTILLCIGTQVG